MATRFFSTLTRETQQRQVYVYAMHTVTEFGPQQALRAGVTTNVRHVAPVSAILARIDAQNRIANRTKARTRLGRQALPGVVIEKLGVTAVIPNSGFCTGRRMHIF